MTPAMQTVLKAPRGMVPGFGFRVAGAGDVAGDGARLVVGGGNAYGGGHVLASSFEYLW
jgi:hypothetical protein